MCSKNILAHLFIGVTVFPFLNTFYSNGHTSQINIINIKRLAWIFLVNEV